MDYKNIPIREDMLNMLFSKISEEYMSMEHVNIIISGKTGVGKTTLINAIFGNKVEKTGIGRPVTEKMKMITIPNYPLRLYDTVGLELNNQQQTKVKNDIINLINEKRNTTVPDQYIHCIWYCINANSNRIEDEEINFIRDLATGADVPVIIILTQSYGSNSKEMYDYIEELNLPVEKCFRVLATDYVVDEDYTKKAFGCEELVDFMIEILPEASQKAFINAQVVSLGAKRKKAQFIIASAIAGAFGEGFIPLPFADAAALVPTQIAMIAGITVTYGMEVKKSTMSALITSLLGSTGATIAGKTIVANLLKLIPGVGTAVGGAISGGTAAIITGALGETYIGIMELMMKGELTEKEIENGKRLEEFKENFKHNIKNGKEEKYLDVVKK